MNSEHAAYPLHRKLTDAQSERVAKNDNPIVSTDRWAVITQGDELQFLHLPGKDITIRAQLRRQNERIFYIKVVVIKSSMSLVEATQILDMVLFGIRPDLDPGRKLESVETRAVSMWQNGFFDGPLVGTAVLVDKTTILYKQLAARYSVVGPKVPVLPYIENTYCDRNTLRIMHVGVNAYTNEADFIKMQDSVFAEESSGWWRSWAKENKWPIHQWITHNHEAFSKQYTSSQYRCNAVKIWLPMSTGKKENLVAKEMFEEAKDSMKAEFDLLSDLQLLPDIVVCYGVQAWKSVWPYFYKKHGGPNSPIVELQMHRAFKINFAPSPLLVCRVTHHSGKRDPRAVVDTNKIVERFGHEMDWNQRGLK